MRPILTPTLTLLAATCLAFLPAISSAQGRDGKPPSADAATTAEPADKAPGEPVLSEQEKAEARRIARLERQKEADRQRLERERQCVIKPVMTDAEIAKCKEVWR
jgi:hypothetical protein